LKTITRMEKRGYEHRNAPAHFYYKQRQ
jgi:hypothetical protein